MAPAGSTGSHTIERRGRRRAWLVRVCITVVLLSCALATAQQTQAASPSDSSDAPSCQTVRLSDVGWTDVTATTAT